MSRYCYMTLRPNVVKLYDGNNTLGIIKKMAPYCFFIYSSDIFTKEFKKKPLYSRIRKYLNRFRIKGDFHIQSIEDLKDTNKADLIMVYKSEYKWFKDNIKVTEFYSKYEEKYFSNFIINTEEFNKEKLKDEFSEIFQIVYDDAHEVKIYDPQLLRSIKNHNGDWWTDGLNYFLSNLNNKCEVTIFVATNNVDNKQNQKQILNNVIDKIRPKTNVKYLPKLGKHHGSIEINNKYSISLDWGFSTFIKDNTRGNIRIDFEKI